MMLKLFPIMCVNRKPDVPIRKQLDENDIEVFEQYIFPQNIVAICPVRDREELPTAKCLVVIAGNVFQCTEELQELVTRVNEAVKDAT